MTYRILDNGVYRDATTEETEQIENQSSGGDELLGDGYKLINEITLTEDIKKIAFDKDLNGNNFSCKEIVVEIYSVGAESNASGQDVELWINGEIKNYYNFALATGKSSNYIIRYRLRPSLEIQKASINTISNYQLISTSVYKYDTKIDSFTSIAFQPQGTQLFGIGSTFKVYGK